jgi:hypothetical protein
MAKTIEHEGLYFEYWITFILYVLANKIFHFESDIIYGASSVVRVLAEFHNGSESMISSHESSTLAMG